MASKLLQKQWLFAGLVSRLLTRAHELGYHVALGDAYRDPRVFGAVGTRKGYGHAKSVHKIRLAIDLNLFTPEGEYLASTEAHRLLGEWWETLHPDCRWGGRFSTPDGNHYSMAHDGMA